MPKRLFCLLGAALLALAACGGGSDPSTTVVSDSTLINWDRNPNTIIFRADVTGGSTDPFIARSEVPVCTVYGDNHVVWTNELGPFNVQVLEDRVSDETIQDFVLFLTLNLQFYTRQSRANLEPASNPAPVVETLLLFVNGVTHTTDAFSEWPPDYYSNVIQACKAISSAPVIYAPAAGWVSAQAVPYDTSAPTLPWDAAANGLDLAALATEGQPRWITDRNVPVIWNILRTSPPNILFTQGEQTYWVALQIPNLTRNAPAAP